MSDFPKTTLPFVEVIWGDAWGDSTGAVFPNDAHEAHKPLAIRTRGWLVVDDEKGVSLFAEQVEDGSFRGRSMIPRAMVKSVTPLRITPPRKEKRVERTEP